MRSRWRVECEVDLLRFCAPRHKSRLSWKRSIDLKECSEFVQTDNNEACDRCGLDGHLLVEMLAVVNYLSLLRRSA